MAYGGIKMELGNISILSLLVRTTMTFIVLLILARLLGRKQMSHLTYFNYITGITIGSIAANIVSSSNQPFIDDFIGLVLWCFLTGLIGFISLKSGDIRRIIDGQPTIVIKKGKLVTEAFKSSRFNLDDLSMMLREKDVFSITEVEYAILEANGDLSILKKAEYQQVTKVDMKVPIQPILYIPSEIISDGKVLKHNLKELNLTEEWLKIQLKKMNISSPKEVLYAEIQDDGTLFAQKY